MKNTDVTERHLLIDKVDVDIDMLSSVMLNGVRGHVDDVDIVTVDNNVPLRGRGTSYRS